MATRAEQGQRREEARRRRTMAEAMDADAYEQDRRERANAVAGAETRPIPLAFEQLQDSLDNLTQVVENLGSRLRHVMYEHLDEMPGVDIEALGDSASHYQERLTRMRWHVEAIRSTVQNITDRLEV